MAILCRILKLTIVILSLLFSHSLIAAGNLLFGSVTPPKVVVIRPKLYDYAPTVLVNDSGVYDIWWCAKIPDHKGDTILHLSFVSSWLKNGPSYGMGAAYPEFEGYGGSTHFDARHTCDPSVIEVGNTYYLYYGGLAAASNSISVTTRLGVATSNDAKTWKRVNGGVPILNPRPILASDRNIYGVGQPSIIALNGYFYLLYTDTVGPDGPGLYVLRSTHPLFKIQAEGWTGQGFSYVDLSYPPRTASSQKRLIANGFSGDWAYIPSKNQFMSAVDLGPPDHRVLRLTTYDSQTLMKKGELDVPMGSTEGPGLSRDRKGWLVYTERSNGQLSFQVFRSIGKPRTLGAARSVPSWDIAVSTVTLDIR